MTKGITTTFSKVLTCLVPVCGLQIVTFDPFPFPISHFFIYFSNTPSPMSFWKVTCTKQKFLCMWGCLNISHSLHKNYPCSQLVWSAFCPHFSAFGLNTENTGKMRTRTIPNTDTFYAVYIKWSRKGQKIDVSLIYALTFTHRHTF